jgi:hypothetical protein
VQGQSTINIVFKVLDSFLRLLKSVCLLVTKAHKGSELLLGRFTTTPKLFISHSDVCFLIHSARAALTNRHEMISASHFHILSSDI